MGSLSAGNYNVEVVEVNNLDTHGTGAMLVPGFSAVSNEVPLMSCPAMGAITVTSPIALGSGSFVAKDFRVFVTPLNGLSGTETLQIPGTNMTCNSPGGVDTAYGCQLGTNATVKALTSGGDSPNLVDLSNPLVVEVGPLGGSGTSAQNEGFWSVLENLTLALPSAVGTNNPNVAFWNPSNQENSGLSFVSFTGVTGNMAPAPVETGAWIYIGNHAPNSFVENVQTDGNPSGSGNFDALILDGRTGFGSATGTARLVSNSTFTPGQLGGTGTIIGAVVTGANANSDFADDHFEVNGTQDCIQVITGASVSAQGNEHSCNPFIHLYSASTSPSGVAGSDIGVRNVTTATGNAVVKDEVNNVTLNTHVSDYSTAKNSPSLTVEGTLSLVGTTSGTVTIKPQAAAGTYEFDMPTTAGTAGQVLTSQGGAGIAMTWTTPTTGTVTTSGSPAAHQVAVFSGATSVTGTASDSTTTHALFATAGDPAFRAIALADLPTGVTVQALGGGQANVMSSTNSIYVPWLGGAVDTVPAHLSAIAPATATIADRFVGVSGPYGALLTVTFTVASCRPSGGQPCAPTDSKLTCPITGTMVTQCSHTADTLSVTQGDEVFLHVTVPTGSTIPSRSVFMSYRLTGVQ